MENALRKIHSVYDSYLKGTGTKCYYAIIPDKNYFLAEKNGFPALNYGALYADMQQGLSYMEYVEIKNLLTIGDYYRTDIHWRQEKIRDVAKHLADAMGITLNQSYTTVDTGLLLNSTVYGEINRYVQRDKLYYLNHNLFKKIKVYDYQNEREIPLYDLTLADSDISYDMYLSGALSLIEMINPEAKTDKELILFRDSFGSSIAPLFLEGYKKITLVDIRYMTTGLLGDYVTFTDQDILFLYSTSALNNRTSFR